MSVPDKLHKLVDRFQYHIADYKSGKYNETQVRRDFIDPLFGLLGWDIDNKEGNAEAYRDVIHEDSIKIGGATKAPDYCFRVGGTRKFFLEAKKPSIHIKEDIAASFQLRRYGWSARLPISILTDFEEFAVYDTRIKPSKSDKVAKARIDYIYFTDYPEHWDTIHATFSKDALYKGAFDKYVETTKVKKGTAQVDSSFLAEIESWRDALARNLMLRNPGLTPRQLNTSVQAVIDRIIFLRMCEDRGIESYGRLQSLLNGAHIYSRLCQQFKEADGRYNSGLFHFEKEKDRPTPVDGLTLSLKVDDKILKGIFRNLYYLDSPFEFSVLPTEILGEVYEQFLGKVIRVTGKRAVVEEKPEVKKAGGVYYTPKYIVDYIVQNTVGQLLKDKKPGKAMDTIKVLDPACGSGSFLIGAYQYLLDWYREYYEKAGPAKYRKVLYKAGANEWRLTTDERKRILLTHIFGVDIDPQAVEVTKLSLLLKVLEGESGETLRRQTDLFKKRVLPDLGGNIKCGNSLIGPDFYQGQQMSFVDEEEQYRINAFDWRAEFKDIMQSGGFDAVIGNPPYLYSAGKDYIEYFNEKFKLSQYQTDYYVYFIEQALRLTKNLGKFSFIVSDSWLNSQLFSNLRNHLLSKHRFDVLAVFDYPVFEQAALENSIFVIIVLETPKKFKIDRFSDPQTYTKINVINPNDAIKRGLIDPRFSPKTNKVVLRIEKNTSPLKNFIKLNRGIHPYRIDGYGKSKFGSGKQTKRDKDTSSYHAEKKLDKTYLPELRGKHVFRYSYTASGKFLSYGPWLAEPRRPEFFFNQKIAIRKILGSRLHGVFIKEPVALDQSLYVLILNDKEDSTILKFILGVLLSSIGAWYLKNKYGIYDKLYPWYTKKQLAEFPMKEKSNSIVELVERMLELNKKLDSAKTAQDKTHLQRRIDATDQEIDRLVYGLYDLTEDEIKIVEESTP